MTDIRTDIHTVTVLGTGVLGAQIAYQTAFAGFQVVAWDITDAAIAAAQALDPFRFGVENTSASLERVIDYSYRQLMIPRKFTIDELFDDLTRTLGA